MPLEVLNMTPLPARDASPVVLMVSGGSDSTALLMRAADGELDIRDGRGMAPIARGRLCVLHVNHHIRGAEADRDERFVTDLCARLGIACVVRHFDVPGLVRERGLEGGDGGASNLEDVARQARYQAAADLVRELCAQAGEDVRTARVLVAHTADDRAETFLMRAMTGAGLSGLVGMRRQRGIVARPLLDETRASLRDYLRQRGIGWCEDSTNDEDDALRSYVRHHVTPAMRERVPAFAQTLGRTSDGLADDADLLDKLAHALLDRAMEAGRPADEDYLAGKVPADGEPRRVTLRAETVAAAEPSLARRAVREAVLLALGDDAARKARLEARHVAWALEVAQGQRESATLPLDTLVVRHEGLVVMLPASVAAREAREREEETRRELSEARDRREDFVRLPVPGSISWGGGTISADLVPVPSGADPHAVALAALAEAREADGLGDDLGGAPGGPGGRSREGRAIAVLDAGLAGVGRGGELAVRASMPGERMCPFGLHGHSKLVRDVLADAGVPAGERGRAAVVHKLARDEESGRVCCGDVVWVAGIRADGRAAYRPSTTVLLRCRITYHGADSLSNAI